MPAFEIRDLFQRATIWAAADADDYGQRSVYAPTTIACRWNQTHTVGLDSKGATITLDAQVIVAGNVKVDSIMLLTGADDGGAGTEYHEVKTISKTPDIKNRNQRYQLGLVKYKGSLPTVLP